MSQPMHANDDATFNAFADALGVTADADDLASLGSQDSLLDLPSQDFHDAAQELLMQEPAARAACGLGISNLALPGNAHDSLSAPDPRDRVLHWEDLVLKLVFEGVHKVDRNEAGSPPEYIVSNLKDFVLHLELMHTDTGLLAMAEGNRLDVRATLLYENGNAVAPRGEDDKLLLGETEVTVIGGKATLKLKMGRNSLSNLRDNRRFRIRIEPRDDALRPEAYPQLSVTGTPFKSVTKIRDNRAQAQPTTPTQQLAALREELRSLYADKELTTERMNQQIADQKQRMEEMETENKRLLCEMAALKQSVNEPPAATDAHAAREDAARAVRDMETGGAPR